MPGRQLTFALILTLFAANLSAEGNTGQTIIKASEHEVNEAPSSRFSGEARFSQFPVMPSPGDVAPATATFEAGTITNWHRHPHGQ